MSKVCHNSRMVVKWSFRVRGENKSVSWLIRAVLLKIWQYPEIWKLTVIRLKAVSTLRIGRKPNRCTKLYKSFKIALFYTNIIKQIDFRRVDMLLRKFLKLVKSNLSCRDTTIVETNSETVISKVSCICECLP